MSPPPPPPRRGTDRRVEMLPTEACQLDCELMEIPERVAFGNNYFNEGRLKHQRFSPRPEARPLARFVDMLKAWAFHLEHATDPEMEPEQGTSDFFEYEDFVITGNSATWGADPDILCPFERITGCVPHSHSDTVRWVPPFEINFFVLCDKTWVGDLERPFAIEDVEEQRKEASLIWG